MSYSTFIHGLSRAGVDLDRKILADLAVHDPAAFGSLAQTARQALEAATAPKRTRARAASAE